MKEMAALGGGTDNKATAGFGNAALRDGSVLALARKVRQ